MVAGNEILITPFSIATSGSADAKVQLTQIGGNPSLNDANGDAIGVIKFNESHATWGHSLTLSVTKTSNAIGVQTFSFSIPSRMTFNNWTDNTIRAKMPFDNTIQIGVYDPETGINGTLGTRRDYPFHFNKLPATSDATTQQANYIYEEASANYFLGRPMLFDTSIPNNTVFNQLQNSAGTSGSVSAKTDIVRAYKFTSTQDLTPNSLMLFKGSYFVSAATNKIQTSSRRSGTLAEWPDPTHCTSLVPMKDAGDNVPWTTLKSTAANSPTTVTYYSRQNQANGKYSYFVAVNIKAADTVLTNDELQANAKDNMALASSANPTADLNATVNYYNSVLGRRASYFYIQYRFDTPDQYKATTSTIDALDDTSMSGKAGSETSLPVQAGSSGQTVVKSHYLSSDGRSLSPTTAQAGYPTGKANSVSGTKGTASAPATPADVAGYRPLTVADLSTLTAAQRQTIATTLGTTDSSVTGLTALANKTTGKTIWATNNLTVPYPGETGKTYNVNGDIVTAGTAGSSTGWGTTDVYYFYTLATQTLNVHAIAVPCYVNSADTDSGKDCDAQPANGTSWQPSDGNEVTSLSETFTGLSGSAATDTLTKYSVQLGGNNHPVSMSDGITQLAPSTAGTKRTISFKLNTTYDMDNNLDQDEYVYIQANPEKDITKTTTRTIHYKLNHNTIDTPPADVTQTITWTQHQIHNTAYDSIDGTANWSKYVWQANSGNTPATSMPKVNSPVINGYTAKTPVVGEITGIQHNGTTDNPSTTFTPTDPANPDTSDRTLTVTVVYNKTIARMPFTGGTGVLLGTLIALALLAIAAMLTHLRNKRTNK